MSDRRPLSHTYAANSQPPVPRRQPSSWLARTEIMLGDDAFWEWRDQRLQELQQESDARQESELAHLQRQRILTLRDTYREPYDPTRAGYSETDLKRILHWTPRNQNGIGLIAPSGHGKTRLLTAVLQKLNCPWLYLTSAQLAMHVADQWSDDLRTAAIARDALRTAQSTRVLMLDDLGDQRPTHAVSEYLKHILEVRTSSRLPIFWTSNYDEHKLASHHGDLGPSIIRRLVEFTWCPRPISTAND